MIKTEGKLNQPFGANATPTYAASGLKGHTGIDFDNGYGSPIHSYWDEEYVYKVLTVDNPSNDGSGFTGVFTIVEQDGKVFEFLYGHCNPTVKVGSILTKGSVLGTQANNGECYQNGVRITLEMQKNGDHRGTHRHDQARELIKSTTMEVNARYITDNNFNGLIRGFYYSIPNFNNGYNGCFDWLTWQQGAILAQPKQSDAFTNMMKAVQTYQISRGIMDFATETDMRKINIGKKTLDAITKDKLK